MRAPRFSECLIASLLLVLWLVAPAWAGGVDVLERGRVLTLLRSSEARTALGLATTDDVTFDSVTIAEVAALSASGADLSISTDGDVVFTTGGAVDVSALSAVSVTGTGHNVAQTYGGEITALANASIDYDDGAVQTITLTGATEFTGPTNDSATHARVCKIVVTDNAGGPHALTFPAAWKWLGTKPSATVDGGIAYLWLTSHGSADSDCVARWVDLVEGE